MKSSLVLCLFLFLASPAMGQTDVGANTEATVGHADPAPPRAAPAPVVNNINCGPECSAQPQSVPRGVHGAHPHTVLGTRVAAVKAGQKKLRRQLRGKVSHREFEERMARKKKDACHQIFEDATAEEIKELSSAGKGPDTFVKECYKALAEYHHGTDAIKELMRLYTPTIPEEAKEAEADPKDLPRPPARNVETEYGVSLPDGGKIHLKVKPVGRNPYEVARERRLRREAAEAKQKAADAEVQAATQRATHAESLLEARDEWSKATTTWTVFGTGFAAGCGYGFIKGNPLEEQDDGDVRPSDQLTNCLATGVGTGGFAALAYVIFGE